MRRKQLGMSPAKIAMAVAVTIEAMAGTGGMKKVTGTRSAVAIVAVRPGTAPTKRPNIAEPRITHSTYGSNTCASAWERTSAVMVCVLSEGEALEYSPRQGNTQQLVEGEVDDDGGDHGHRHGDAPRRAEHAHPDQEDQKSSEVETEDVSCEDIKQEPSDNRGNARDRARAADPRRRRKQRHSIARRPHHEQRAAHDQANGDEPGKPCGAEFLPRH